MSARGTAGAGPAPTAEARAAEFRDRFEKLEANLGKVIVGHQEPIRQILLTVLCGGHALLEGTPGLGKTLLVKTLAASLELDFSRIQFTPDLMPADITGTNLLVERGGDGGGPSFKFQEGPIFSNVVLADEINRATPKTQSALLEAMEEASVTVAKTTRTLRQPFVVIATQNPIEMEGTYPLPEAQLDRFFFKIHVGRSGVGDLVEILDRTTGTGASTAAVVAGGPELLALRATVREVVLAAPQKEAIARLVLATHPDGDAAPDEARRYVKYGASPRGGQAVALAAKALALRRGRYNVATEDIAAVALPALRHRIILNFEGEAEGVGADVIIAKVRERVLGAAAAPK